MKVVNRSDEEATHYLRSRTKDKYDYIVSKILEAVEQGSEDIVVTPEVKRIVEEAQKSCCELIVQQWEPDREKALKSLNEYVKAYPELALSEILTDAPVEFKDAKDLQEAFECVKEQTEKYIVERDPEMIAKEERFNARTEELHKKVMERILFYSEQFYKLWGDKSLVDERRTVRDILQKWQEIDYRLQVNYTLSNIERLPKEEQALAREVNEHIDEYKKSEKARVACQSGVKRQLESFEKAWNVFFKFVKKEPSWLTVLLRAEAVERFGLSVPQKSSAPEFNEDIRKQILRELTARREIIISDVVKAFSENYDKTSVIDNQYNGGKLELFRTYYRLKGTDAVGSVKALEARIDEIEQAHTSLVMK